MILWAVVAGYALCSVGFGAGFSRHLARRGELDDSDYLWLPIVGLLWPTAAVLAVLVACGYALARVGRAFGRA